MKTNYRKQTILITIFLTMFSSQLLFAQEETEEIKAEEKNEIIQKEQKEEQITTENQTNEEVIPATTLEQENKNVTNKKYFSKKQSKKKSKKNNSKNQTPQTASSKKSSKEGLTEENKKSIFHFIFFAIGVYIIYRIIAYRYRRKCKHCGKWNAMRETGTYCVGEKDSRIKETTKVRDGDGKVLRTYEEFVPATTYFYETHRKCKYCNFKDVLKSSETKKN
ncbi:hypothetical protein [Capnocytophaga gingivalis]|uniref:hypothetical protein n=2 Tax=Capnocytophaga TaxID=1016 RepID=UPI0028E5EC04|nr:hypothetical protein [Capnocytophaga gingivalis]